MKKSMWGWVVLFSILVYCSSAASQFSRSKVQGQLQFIFSPYKQIELSPSIQSFIQSKVQASTYSIQYSRTAAMKEISLDNALVKVKVYYNGYPQGIVTIATDKQQRFLFPNLEDRSSVVFEVLSIVGQDQAGANCRGDSLPGHPDIVIECR
ncbi:MAG: hypothetical protein KIT56_09580 [Gammaproteobacteria bacterium]|nr:hypothetical protein [Gammaproteobacteria bacterium]MCW5584103.1 hypothetical protein [Gammaproteobacteria bacterium]